MHIVIGNKEIFYNPLFMKIEPEISSKSKKIFFPIKLGHLLNSRVFLCLKLRISVKQNQTII